MSFRAVVVLGCASLALTALPGCSSNGTAADGGSTSQSSSASPTGGAGVAATGDLPVPDHVMVVVFENEDAKNIIGGATLPT